MALEVAGLSSITASATAAIMVYSSISMAAGLVWIPMLAISSTIITLFYIFFTIQVGVTPDSVGLIDLATKEQSLLHITRDSNPAVLERAACTLVKADKKKVSGGDTN